MRRTHVTRSNVDASALLTEIRKQVLAWEVAPVGSRQEYEAAEAATRAMAELDIALCDGTHLPVPWQRAQYPSYPAPDANCPACGMELADPKHTLADPACRNALGARLENQERPA